MLEYYHRKGYSENWINQRLKSIEVRKELTDEWERRGIKKGQEYATLTDIITLGWSGMTTRQYKQYKGLKTESLRDNMTNLEKPRPEKESYRRSRQNRHWPKKQPKGSNTRRRIRQNDPTVRNRFEAAICDLEFEITKWDIQLE